MRLTQRRLHLHLAVRSKPRHRRHGKARRARRRGDRRAHQRRAGSPLGEAADSRSTSRPGRNAASRRPRPSSPRSSAGLAMLAGMAGRRGAAAALAAPAGAPRGGCRLRLERAGRRRSRRRDSLFILGRGPAIAIASEAALKFKETCGMHAEAYSAAEVLHGPVSIVGRVSRCWRWRSRDAAEAAVAETAGRVAAPGGRGLRHVRERRRRACAALRRHGPSAHRSAGADRLLLRLHRGAGAPARHRPGLAAATFAR